jgi:hypothetical protein
LYDTRHIISEYITSPYRPSTSGAWIVPIESQKMALSNSPELLFHLIPSFSLSPLLLQSSSCSSCSSSSLLYCCRWQLRVILILSILLYPFRPCVTLIGNPSFVIYSPCCGPSKVQLHLPQFSFIGICIIYLGYPLGHSSLDIGLTSLRLIPPGP